MYSKTSIPLRILLAILLLFQFHGCTILGLTIGALKDRAQPETKPVEISYLRTVKPGTPITLILKDGAAVQGKYRGFTVGITPTYQQRLARYRSQVLADHYFPAIGDTIRVTLKNGTQVINTFAGVDIQFLLLNGKTSSLPLRIPLSGIRTIQDDYHSLSLNILQEGIKTGRIPLATQVFMITREGSKTIPLQEIEQVNIRVKKRHAARGFLIGLGIDFLVFLLFVHGLSSVPVGR